MSNQVKQLEIIQAVGRGEISVEEGSQQLAALDAQETAQINEPSVPAETVFFTDSPQPPRVVSVPPEELLPVGEARTIEQEFTPSEEEKGFIWKKVIWILPFTAGILLTVLSGAWMASSYDRSGLGWGFWLSWIPLILGLLIMILAWGSKNMIWLHVRIRQKPGETPQKINISFPLPLGLSGLALKMGAPFLPEKFRDPSTLEGIRAIIQTISKDNPIQVMVDDEDGEKVEVFIG